MKKLLFNQGDLQVRKDNKNEDNQIEKKKSYD